MSPTVLRAKGYRFFFFSREEPRPHVHINGADGEAKFWLEPEIPLVRNQGLSRIQLREIEQIIEEHEDDLRAAWNTRFGR